MTGLYPIIRRARRPLIIEDDDSGPPPPPPSVPLVQDQAPVSYLKRSSAKGKEKRAADDPKEQQ